jgi:hypothetical protein
MRATGSNEGSGEPLSDEAPAAVTLSDPSNVQSGQVGLSWTESGAADFASYKVYRSTQPVVCALDTLVSTGVQVSGVTCQDTGVSPDTTYYYRVFVLDEGGQGTPSNEKSAYTPATSAEAPTVSVVSVCDQAPVSGAIPEAVNGSRFTVHVSFARGATTAAKVKELRLYFDSNQSPSATVPLSPPQAGGIGRASCRERV